MPKLLIIDDHPVVQMGVKSFCERNKLFDTYQIAANGKEAVSLCQEIAESQDFPDLILMDINLPDFEIISLVRIIRNLIPKSPILMFSMEPAKLYIKRLVDLGINGFIEKTSPDEELHFAILNLLHGKNYFSSEILMESIASGSDHRQSINCLSQRESEVLSLMIQGKTSREIAEILKLHNSSVASYRARIFQKLELETSLDLYKWALNEGLILPS
ncbi:response regulator transcription factor [Croceimicrobium sp.]|uniref:response regulator transcription factor n=1 Tax=Croceimicrobium sp. TaxID=2828340 RepID=UPI003BA8C288